MNNTDCVELGYIAKAHGIKGEVKAVFDVQDITEYRKRSPLYVSKKGAPLEPLEVVRFSVASATEAVIKFAGFSNVAEAEELKGSTLFFPVEALPKLGDGHYYYFDVEGFTIIDEVLGELGTLRTITEMPHQDLLIMDYQGHEVLIPLIEQFVLGPDMAAKTMRTRLPEGLLDIYMIEDKNEEKDGDGEEGETEGDGADAAETAKTKPKGAKKLNPNQRKSTKQLTNKQVLGPSHQHGQAQQQIKPQTRPAGQSMMKAQNKPKGK